VLVNPATPDALAAAAAEVVHTHPHMAIATVGPHGEPWAVPVHQHPLADGRLAWRSRIGARHSQNLATNPKTAITIFSTSGEQGEVGVYFEGTSQIVTDPDELNSIITWLYAHEQPRPTPADFTGPAEYRLYAFTPTALWLNDDSHTKYPVELSRFLKRLRTNPS
jgi:hypothetical protein